MEIQIRQAYWRDVQDLIEQMREEDVREISVGGGYPETSVTKAYRDSRGERYVAVEKNGDGLVAMFGMANRGSYGVPWMLATPRLSYHAKSLVRESKAYVARWMTKVPILVNRVHKDNFIALRWLVHLGFTNLSHDGSSEFIRFKWEDPNVRHQVR